MKKYCLVTTFYCDGCTHPSNEGVVNKLRYDGPIEDFFVNFSNLISPHNFSNIPNIGISKRKDLVYGKIFLLKKFIEKNILNRYQYICHVDFSDVKFRRSFVDMMMQFEKEDVDIIISTEKNCWPYLETVRTWTNKEIPNEEFSFLNSGGVISKVEVFLKILESLENFCIKTNIDFWDDQGVWQYYDIIHGIEKDKICNYFFSTALLDNSYFSSENNKIITKFGTEPYIIHDNSSFSLNLISTF
jgi:hypothetical protein